MEFEFTDQFALMPTVLDMLLAGPGLESAGDPALMDFLRGQGGAANLGAGSVDFVLFGPDAVSATDADALIQERGGCGCSGMAAQSGDGAAFQIIETPWDEFDPALDPQFGYVDTGNGGYDDANGNGQWDVGEQIFATGRRQTEDRVVNWDPWGSGGGGGGGSGDGGGGGGIVWTDPNQPTENTCASDALTITVSGNNVTITGKITFVGLGADENTASTYLTSINRTWTGTFGLYSVTTQVTIGSGGLVANIDASAYGGQWAELGGMKIWAPTLTGATAAGADYNTRKFAHEFGHSLGLMDMYDIRTGARAAGYGNNIMGNEHASPGEQNIRDLLAKLAKGCSEAS